jgi:hypothetical protein
MMCLRTDEFVKEPIRIKNKISQKVTSNTIAEILWNNLINCVHCLLVSIFNFIFVILTLYLYLLYDDYDLENYIV